MSQIIWNAENRKWIIHSLGGNTTKASTNSANSDYPLGSRFWEIQEGKCEGKSRLMSLTSCNETMFACSNGMCIPIENKCDRPDIKFESNPMG